MCSVCLAVSMPAERRLTSAATLATREAAELFINCGTDGNLEKLLIFFPPRVSKNKFRSSSLQRKGSLLSTQCNFIHFYETSAVANSLGSLFAR